MQRRKNRPPQRLETPDESEPDMFDTEFEDPAATSSPPTLDETESGGGALSTQTSQPKKKHFLLRRPGRTLAAVAVIAVGTAGIGLLWPTSKESKLPPARPDLSPPPIVDPRGAVPDPNTLIGAIDPNAPTADPNATSTAGSGTIASVRPTIRRITDPNAPPVAGGVVDPNVPPLSAPVLGPGPLSGEWKIPAFPGLVLSHVDDGKVTGTYNNGKGFIEGAVDGDTLKFKFWTGVDPGKPFEEASMTERGPATFKVSPDNNELEGWWKYDWEGIGHRLTATKKTPPAHSTVSTASGAGVAPPSGRITAPGIPSGPVTAATPADPNVLPPEHDLVKLDEPQKIYKLTSKSGYNFLAIKGREDPNSVEIISLYTPKGNLLRDEFPKPLPDNVVMGGRRTYRTQDFGSNKAYSLTEMKDASGEPLECDVFYEPELSPEDRGRRQWQKQLDGLGREKDVVKAEADLQRSRNDLTSLRGARIIDRAEYNQRLEQLRTQTVQERRQRRYRRW